MANVKISELTNLGAAPANDDELVIVDKDGGGASGTTKKVTVSDLLSSAGSATTINNNADNRVITGSNTANTLEGEANLLYDAGILDIKNAGVQSEVKLYCESANSHFVSLKAPAHAAISPNGSYTLTLPAAYAVSNGQVLSSTTAGSLSWTSDITGNAAGLSQTLAVTSGGTGLATVPQGSVLVANAADTLTALEGVTDGHVLTYNSGTDTVSWSAPSGGSGTDLDGQLIDYNVQGATLVAGDHEGQVVFLGTDTITTGNLYYWDGTNWQTTSNNAESTAKGPIGIALGANSATDGVLLQGVYYPSSTPAGSAGSQLYLGASANLTATAPVTNGKILRVMGQNLDGTRILFQPSQDFIELGSPTVYTTSIDDLSDVDTTTVAPTDGQALVWDNTAQQWEPGTISGGGSGTSLDGQKLEYIVSSSALTAAGDYEGLVLKVGDAGNTLTAGTVYHFDATQTDWVAADNTAEGTAKGVLGIALGASGTTDGVLIQGVYYYADAAGVTGDVLFLGTSGAMTATAPTSDGEILRVMGQNIDNNIVMFQPSQDFIELGAAAATTSIDDLSDVDTTTVAPTDGQALVWDNAAQQWEPGTVSGGSFDLVNDTTPQLGGDLDVNGNSIVSTTNGNIAITPDGTGAVVLDGLSYPTADGAANQPLITNGSGVISFGSTVKATLQGPVDGSDLDVKIETSAATAAGDGEGVVVYFGTGTTVAGKVYTFSSGSWVAVSAATGGEATTKGLLAMALSNSGPSGGMLLYGVGFIDHAHGGSIGSVLYVGDGATAGEITATQPAASTEYVRVVGHAITTSDAAGSKIFFSPSQDWIEIA